jgi:Domain of unknown function (DUF3806)
MPQVEPRIEAPNDAEREWIESNLRVSRSFAKAYGGDDTVEGVPRAAALDLAWTTWLQSWDGQPEESRPDPNPIINAVALAFGQHLVDALGLQWAVVTDEYGTELAVHGDPGDILVFPANLVAKRFESRTVGFIAPLLQQMVADIGAARTG